MSAALATDRGHFAYRRGHNFHEPFWELYYPKTDRLSTAELVTIVLAQCPDWDEPLGLILPADTPQRDAATLVLDCHIARLYHRAGPARLENEYSAALDARYREAITATCAAHPEWDGNPDTALFDAVYDTLPDVLAPSQRAVVWAMEETRHA